MPPLRRAGKVKTQMRFIRVIKFGTYLQSNNTFPLPHTCTYLPSNSEAITLQYGRPHPSEGKREMRNVWLNPSAPTAALWSRRNFSYVNTADFTHGFQTFSPLVANVWHSTESFHLLSLSRLECPKAVFLAQFYS